MGALPADPLDRRVTGRGVISDDVSRILVHAHPIEEGPLLSCGKIVFRHLTLKVTRRIAQWVEKFRMSALGRADPIPIHPVSETVRRRAVAGVVWIGRLVRSETVNRTDATKLSIFAAS